MTLVQAAQEKALRYRLRCHVRRACQSGHKAVILDFNVQPNTLGQMNIIERIVHDGCDTVRTGLSNDFRFRHLRQDRR
ncbi:MAG: hypothetical protein DHS20C04_24060 [Hyphococcus sp.]|nr:MAG: hypothetical protein DHS20C04_24060 [Marinicaulis sp.]